jgi:hypothetical protein
LFDYLAQGKEIEVWDQKLKWLKSKISESGTDVLWRNKIEI